MTSRELRMSWLVLACAYAFGSSLSACGARSVTEVGGETNWLVLCADDGDCDQGSCLCGVCTQACGVADDCTGAFAGSCVAKHTPAAESLCLDAAMPPGALCLPKCERDADCGDGFACTLSSCIPRANGSGGAGGSGAGGVGGAGGGTTGGAKIEDAPAGTVIVEGTRLCAGKACAAGEVCCLVTGECFDRSSPASCPVPPVEGTPPGFKGAPPDAVPCASDIDCRADEYCGNDVLCLGVGYCMSRTNCGHSSGPRSWCGCDGITYPNTQSACFAGARIGGEGPCGASYLQGDGGSFAGSVVVACGSDADCTDGLTCCALTGNCYDEARPIECAEPPPGSDRACLDDTDCLNDNFCYAEGCDGPGGCKSRGSADCTGLLDPVCGCDGKSYTNADCAITAGVRVAQGGKCPGDASM